MKRISFLALIPVLTGWISMFNQSFANTHPECLAGGDRNIYPHQPKDTFPSHIFPDITKPRAMLNRPRHNLVITVDAKSRIFSGDRELAVASLDSTLKIEMDKLRKDEFDSVTIVINADTAAVYGRVYQVMRAAKKLGAKVVARVD